MDATGEVFRRMFHYMALETPPKQLARASALFVFGRQDRLLAETAATLFKRRLAPRVLVTGGAGKDSGSLTAQGLTESDWLAGEMVACGIPHERIIIENQASNGRENSEFGLDALVDCGVELEMLTAVVHATSARRLATMLSDALKRRGLDVALQVVPTCYDFDPNSESDREEVTAEIRRLVEWPEKFDLSRQPADDPVPAEFREFLELV